MSSSPNKRDTPVPPDKSTVILLLSTIGDTTLRMFTPTIGFTIIGIYGDNILHTKPWLTISGVLLGAAVAGLLVSQQIKKVKKS